MEIENVVNEEFAKIVESGFIQTQVREQLERTIKDSIRNTLQSYSDFGKELDKKVKEACGMGNLRLSLPEYNQLISTWVLEIVNRELVSVGKAQIEENLKAFFRPLEKTEWKISEIIEKFKHGMDDDGESGEITFICEEQEHDDYVDYYFDKDEGTGKYNCSYRLRTNKDGVWAAQIGGSEAGKMKTPCLFGFDSFMFQLFALKAKVINDSDYVATEYGEVD